MPLPLVADSIDAIPEAARGAYVEKDGKFHLDAPIEDATGLKNKIAEKIAENKRLAARAAVIGDRTPEEVQADLEYAAKAREEKAKAEGNFEQMKAQLVGQHTKELEKANGRGKKLEGKLYDVMAKREVEAAIVAAGGNPKVLLPHVLPHVKPIESDDDWTVKVVDGKGNVRIADAQGSEMTIAQLVETFKADETFGIAFAASGATGSGARNDGTTVGRGGVVIIPKDASPQEYRRLKAEAEKAGRSYKVAS